MTVSRGVPLSVLMNVCVCESKCASHAGLLLSHLASGKDVESRQLGAETQTLARACRHPQLSVTILFSAFPNSRLASVPSVSCPLRAPSAWVCHLFKPVALSPSYAFSMERLLFLLQGLPRSVSSWGMEGTRVQEGFL